MQANYQHTVQYLILNIYALGVSFNHQWKKGGMWRTTDTSHKWRSEMTFP